jgi:hypothetical protein
MNMITPPKNQGQIVETSYGWVDGCLYRRIVDTSDRSVVWEVADEDESDHLPPYWIPRNGPPKIDTWILCDHAPEGDR